MTEHEIDYSRFIRPDHNTSICRFILAIVIISILITLKVLICCNLYYETVFYSDDCVNRATCSKTFSIS